MKPTSEEQKKNFQAMVKQYPEFGEFIKKWRSEELETLPFGRDQLDVMRGRVQALTEMQRLLGL